jgi:hypothetical protein
VAVRLLDATKSARNYLRNAITTARLPSILAVPDRSLGTVLWFGVQYDLRSEDGKLPGAEPATLTVYKTPSQTEIGRMVPDGDRVHLTFTSKRRVDRRALRRVAQAWFESDSVS